MFIIKKAVKITSLLTAFFMLAAIAGCSIKKEVTDPNTNAPLSEVTVKPGTFKDVKYTLTVTNDQNVEPTLKQAQQTYGLQAEDGPPPVEAVVVDTLTSAIPEGFKVSLISLDGTPLDTPTLIKEGGEIIRVPHNFAVPEYTISYILRIENNQQEAYEQNPSPEALSKLFNFSFDLTTEARFEQVIPDNLPEEPSLQIAKAIDENPEPEVNEGCKTITVNTGAAGKISPVLEYVSSEDGKNTAHWGYLNDNNFRITLPKEDSKITSGTLIGENAPPSVFEKGRVKDVYTPDFSSNVLVWRIKGPDGQARTSTASAPTLNAALTADKGEVKAGEVIDYKMTVTNPTEKDTFNNVKLINTIPDGLEVLGLSGSGFTPTGEPDQYSSVIASLASGASSELHLQCKVLDSFSGDKFVDKLKVEYTVNSSLRTMKLEVSTNFKATEQEQPKMDLKLTMTGKDKVKPGEEIEYKLTAENLSSRDAYHVILYVDLPKGITFTGDTAIWKLQDGKYVYIIDRLQEVSKKELTFKVKVNDPFTETEKKVIATAELNADYLEVTYDNNTATCETLVEITVPAPTPTPAPAPVPTPTPVQPKPELPMTGGTMEVEMLTALIGMALVVFGVSVKRVRRQAK